MGSVGEAWALFQKGGSVMYVLLICSIVSVTIGVERWLFYKKADAGRAFAQRFYDLCDGGSYADAAKLARETKGMLPELLSAGFSILAAGQTHVSSFLEVQSGIMLSRLRNRLYFLSVIVTLSPLLGLLGTIVGMISAFSVFDLDAGQATAITGGVGEALIATAFGLCVAILALVIHSFYLQSMENILTDMEQCCSLLEGRSEEIAAELSSEAGA